MSQNDLAIANQGFASFRTDLNSALQALGSTNSGTSAPSTTYANMLWYDATNNILKIRNEANDAFINLFTLDQTNDNIEALTISGALTYTGDLISSTAGTSNFRAGVNAGNSIASNGNYNVVVGDEAGTALSTGDKNVAIGFEALKTEDANGGNTAIGYRALKVQDGGAEVENTAIGKGAGQAIDLGRENVLVGANVGDALDHADFNVAMGNGALGADVKGHKSTAIGYASLNAQSFSSSTDSHNTAVGYFAGVSLLTSQFNTLIGSECGDALTTGGYNTALGYRALSTEDANGNCVAIGFEALRDLNAGTDSENTAVGLLSGASLTTGVNNTLIGSRAGDALTDSDNNVAVGKDSLSADTQGSRSVAIGKNALKVQNFTSATDTLNTAVGHDCGKAVTTGKFNTIIGSLAGDALTHSSANTFIGHNSGGAYLGADANTFNTFLGTDSGSAMSTGTKNTILGSYDGNENGLDIRTSSNNIVLSDGDGNPRLRMDSDGRLGLDSHVDMAGILIYSSLGSGGVAIQTTPSLSHAYLAYKMRNVAGTQIGSIACSTSATAYNTSSDYRLKENVSYSFDATSRLKQLKPARFNFIIDADNTVDGFLAHEVSSIVPEAITGDKDATESMTNVVLNADGTRLTDDVTQEKWLAGKADETYASNTTWVASQTVPDYQSIDQSKLVPLLVKTIQELEARITALEG